MNKLKKFLSIVTAVDARGINSERYNRCFLFFIIIVTINILGLIACVILAFIVNTKTMTFISHTSTYLQFITFFSTLVVFAVGLKSELLISQSYDFAKNMSTVASHQFSDFSSHIEYLHEFIHPSKFKTLSIDLYIAVSTPIYGIASSIEDAQSFHDFLEMWVEHYEKIEETHGFKPTIQLAIWEKNVNISTFSPDGMQSSECSKLKSNIIEGDFINKYDKLFKRLKTLENKGVLRFELFHTNKSDVRLFLAKSTERHEKYLGLFSVFNPLTPPVIQAKCWTLTGFSFDDETTYKDAYLFFEKLIKREYDTLLEKSKLLRKNFAQRLKNHYNIRQ